MFFQEILRLLHNYRHRSATTHGNIGPSQNIFRMPGFLRFHIPIRLRIPDLPPAVKNTKVYAKLQQCALWAIESLTNTPSMNAERLQEYVTPEGTSWAPHSPGPGMAMQLHKTAAIAVFCVIYLPYSIMFSLIASLAAIGVRASFPRLWQFSVYLGTVGWLPTLVLASIYLGGRLSLYQRRKQSWKIWTQNAERRIREFEGLRGLERARQERRFFDWVRDGEGDEGWFFDELESYSRAQSDEESSIGVVSSIGVAIEGDQWRSMLYSTDSGYEVSSSSPSQESTTVDSSSSVASGPHAIREPDQLMLELRSMEGFDTAELPSNRALQPLPSIDDGLAITVADGAGTT